MPLYEDDIRPRGFCTVAQVEGEFSFRSAPEGPVFSTKYRAGEEGFLPEGEHLPHPPQVIRSFNNHSY
jgi:hypothetical protein